MQEELLNAIKQQIKYLENHAAPDGLESTRMELLETLLQARTGDIQRLSKNKDLIRELKSVIEDPNLPTRESNHAHKLELAIKDNAYRSALQDGVLQETLNTALKAAIGISLEVVLYMISVLGPVVSLMDNPEDDE
jgi:hypothetical protein